MKLTRTIALILALVMTLLLPGFASAEGVEAVGFASSAEYIEYTDLGGFGSDFTRISYSKLVLHADGTYELTTNNFLYAGAWQVISTETDTTVYGTYTVSFNDEFGVGVELSAATRVTQRAVVSSSTTYCDTADLSTFTDTTDEAGNVVTAQENLDALLAAYGDVRVAEINYETYGLLFEE